MKVLSRSTGNLWKPRQRDRTPSEIGQNFCGAEDLWLVPLEDLADRLDTSEDNYTFSDYDAITWLGFRCPLDLANSKRGLWTSTSHTERGTYRGWAAKP
jgi:hypothetical protein